MSFCSYDVLAFAWLIPTALAFFDFHLLGRFGDINERHVWVFCERPVEFKMVILSFLGQRR